MVEGCPKVGKSPTLTNVMVQPRERQSYASRASRIRNRSHAPTVLTFLDASSLASTAPLEISDKTTAPDFVAISFQKIFGHPKLGGLLCRRNLPWPAYSRCQEEEVVTSVDEALHTLNNTASHDELEKGKLDFQSILDLGHGIDVHRELYGLHPMEAISKRTTSLAQMLVRKLQELVHGNGEPVVRIYKSSTPSCWNPSTHGPVVAMNLMRADGSFVDCRAVVKAAASRNIRLASRALWNYDGIATNYQWDIAKIEPARRLHSDQEMSLSKLSTDVIRVSLGAMSTEVDVLIVSDFVNTFYVERYDSAV
jgi:molybdenum cofactor sulfurtransferase